MLPISLSRARKFISILNFTLWKVKEGRGEKKQQKRKAITTLARPLLVSTINRFSADLYTLSPMHPCKTAWNSQPLYAGKPAEEWERKLALFFFFVIQVRVPQYEIRRMASTCRAHYSRHLLCFSANIKYLQRGNLSPLQALWKVAFSLDPLHRSPHTLLFNILGARKKQNLQ